MTAPWMTSVLLLIYHGENKLADDDASFVLDQHSMLAYWNNQSVKTFHLILTASQPVVYSYF